MKSRIFAILLAAALTPWSLAADTTPGAEDTASPVAPDKGQIEVLLAPVALYPDALVALILPAATHPSEVVLASRFLQSGGKDEDIDSQPWDDSVKALAHYPEVIEFMDENLAWTQDVGDAFVAYPADVMTAIQTLRARAARNGMLANTPQQNVIFDDDDNIRIVPAEPDVIYVPYYEPSYLYYTDAYVYYPSSLVWFSVGYGIGSWLSYDCSWSHRTIWVTHYSHWDRGYDWRRRYDHNVKWHVGGSDWNRWKPSPGHRYSRPRGDFNFAHTTRNDSGWNRGGDRDWNRTRDTNNGAWTRHPSDSFPTGDRERSISRPDTLHNPSSVDRNNRDNRTDRRARDNSTSLNRYTETPTIESNDSSTPDPRAPSQHQRSLAPIHRRPDIVNQRDGSLDHLSDTPRPSTPAPAVRREQPRERVSAPTQSPAPSRTITSGADIRHPRSAPSPAPARIQSAPSTVTRSEPARTSPPSPNSNSIRHGRSDTKEN